MQEQNMQNIISHFRKCRKIIQDFVKNVEHVENEGNVENVEY